MEKDYYKKGLLGGLLGLSVLLAGCCISIGSCCDYGWEKYEEKYERTVQVSAPLSAGSLFATQTHNGSIMITGADVKDCNVTATITARAGSEEEAKRIAEETKIKLTAAGNRLTAEIEKPPFMTRQSVSVSFDVKVPKQTNLKLVTHNGEVEIVNITGEVDGTTHNGSVNAEGVSGSIKLETHNGSVTCKDMSGDLQARTHNGRVKAYYAAAAPGVCNVSIVSHNGDVEFAAPPNFSANADVSTHNGSIKTELPITVTGEVSKRKLAGAIGKGEGKLYLETHNGSIKIR